MLKQSYDSNSINQFKIFNIKIRGSIFISKIVVLKMECEDTRKLFKGIQNFLRTTKSIFFFNINEFDDNRVA